MSRPRTLFDKLWDSHAIALPGQGDAGKERRSLLWIDRHFVHEGSHHAFARLAGRGSRVARPDLTFAVADHYVPVRGARAKTASPEIERMIRQLERNSAENAIALFGAGDPRQGIVHVVGPEEGLTLPGLTVVCGDSHTSTHGAFGAFAFGIGASEVAHVLATQTLWQRKPKQMRVTVDGRLPAGVAAKDVILSIIARIGAGGAVGHAIEYAGSTIRGLSMEGRMTICNMSIECGARLGMVAPDDVTFDWIAGRPYAPAGDDFDKAVEAWSGLGSDPDAAVDREVAIAADEIAPVVTWGNSPEDALPITAFVPDPARIGDADKARSVADALDYMGLVPGRPLERHRHRPGLHRIVHQRAHRGPARCRRGPRRAARQGAGPHLSRLDAGQAPGGGGGARPNLPRGRPRMGGRRVLDVRGDERRRRAAGRALRQHHQPQLPRPPGAGIAHPPDVAGDGRRRRGCRLPHRRSPDAGRAAGPGAPGVMQPFVAVTSRAVPLDIANVDTDQIIPARFMTRPRAEGLRSVPAARSPLRRGGT